MKTAIIRLDGVLVPPIWIQIAEVARLPGLLSAEWEHSDRDLFNKRISIIQAEGISIGDLKFIATMYEPFAGADIFVNSLRQSYRTILVSDAPPFLANHFASLFPGVELHCEPRGTMQSSDYLCTATDFSSGELLAKETLNDKKILCVGHTDFDLPMIWSATESYLFNPSPILKRIATNVRVATKYSDIAKVC